MSTIAVLTYAFQKSIIVGNKMGKDTPGWGGRLQSPNHRCWMERGGPGFHEETQIYLKRCFLHGLILD